MKTICSHRSFRRFALALAAAPGFLAEQATARTWLIDNNTANPADFRNMGDAASSASVVADDVLLLQGSANPYDAGSNAITFNKRVHIVGPGYFLTENSIPSVNHQPAYLRLTLAAGAAGSTVTGIGNGFALIIDANNVAVSRCRYANITVNSSSVSIRQCYVDGQIAFLTTSQNCLASNCYMTYALVLAGANCTGSHCVIAGTPPVNIATQVGASSTLVNSVILNGAAGFSFTSTGTVTNCIAGTAGSNPGGNGSFLPAGNGNINGSSEAAIFAGGASPDMKWSLKAGSPAIGTGSIASDMGMFGGAAPYVMSGLPARPRIKQLLGNGAANTATGLRIHVEAEAKN